VGTLPLNYGGRYKAKIQTDNFNSQDYLHGILGQKRRSAYGIIASRLSNKAHVYSDTLKKLRRTIQNERRGVLSRGVVMLHD
jgi:hypothetical protein